VSQNKAPNNNVFYRNQNWHYPKISHGKGIYLVDNDGKSYIDGCSGSAVANIGHGNEEIAEYAAEQMKKVAFTHLSRWTVDTIEDCAERIAKWSPKNMNHVYFVSGGSEATETAIKIARQYFYERDGEGSTKWKVISKWNAFHGNTIGALSMTGIKGRRKPYNPMLLDFPKIPQFYHYRNEWGYDDIVETSIRCAQSLEEEILRQGPENVAAFISEPIVGSAAPGVSPDKIYFEMVRKICDKYDVLLIIDEVMSGFGRTGKKLCLDYYGIEPDIISCAKGLSCGYTPFGATIVSDRVFEEVMVKGSGHFVHGHTYAGNPLSCGIANKVLEIVEREGYVDNCFDRGQELMSKLEGLYDIPIVGDIRGKGLMIGIEFVANQETKEPFAREKDAKNVVMNSCLESGLVIYPGGGSVDGKLGDHILIAPPINISEQETVELFERLRDGIEKANNILL
jgi:adenosylmethionine-8-amino-7-oxononanoate aminotransferase